MAGAVGTFKSDHHVIFGLSLVTAGVFGLIGSLNGHLAVMLSALFDPAALSDSNADTNSAPLVPPNAATPPEAPTVPTTPEITSGAPGAPELPVGGLGSIGDLFGELAGFA